METPDPPAPEQPSEEPTTTPKAEQPAAAPRDPTVDRLFWGVTIAVAVGVLAFLLVPWGPLYVSIEVIDAAVLLGWGALDLNKYRLDPNDKIHLRDGVLLMSLGALTIAAVIAGVMRDAPRSLSGRQQAKIADAVRSISGTEVRLWWQAPDEDADRLANQFKAAFEAGGLHVDPRPAMPFGGVRGGIGVTVPDDEKKKAVFQRVFQIARMQADGSLSNKNKFVEIWIGPKPH
ncbi:MAG: hypothetical protein JWO36_6211 [Myxococcales bacterium]|nr:hypothetical protein [Myxococcales bacterium]